MSRSPFQSQVARMLVWSFLSNIRDLPLLVVHVVFLFFSVGSGEPLGLSKVRLTCVAGPTWPLTHLSRHAAPFKSYQVPLAKVTLKAFMVQESRGKKCASFGMEASTSSGMHKLRESQHW